MVFIHVRPQNYYPCEWMPVYLASKAPDLKLPLLVRGSVQDPQSRELAFTRTLPFSQQGDSISSGIVSHIISYNDMCHRACAATAGAFPTPIRSNLCIKPSSAFSPSSRYRVTFRTFFSVKSFNPSGSCPDFSRPSSSVRCRATALAVIANRISLGPSTSSRMADGAWSSLSGSTRKTRVYPPGRERYRSRIGPKSFGRS